MIREQDPLKQGLKLCHFFGRPKTQTIREQDPLKQGLKPVMSDLASCDVLFVSKIH